jgi:hypothetical protein
MPYPDDTDDLIWERKGLTLGDRFRVSGALDTEARGNWARAVQADSLHSADTGDERQVALKIMRAQHLDSEGVYGMFGREARVLDRFGTDVSATKLLACGFVRTPSGLETLVEMVENVDAFTAQMTARRLDNWRPMLVLQLVPFERTLLYRMRQVYSSRNPYLNAMVPLWEAITITVRGLTLLDKCHKEHLYYIDHKPEHVIWHDGRVRFLDWNAGEWSQGQRTGSFPQGLIQNDVLNYTGYVVFPLFTGVQLDGAPVSSIQRGTPHPPPIHPADGELIKFFDAEEWLDKELKTILSRPFWTPEKRYANAQEMADALLSYLEKWKVGGLYERLLAVVNEVEVAQQSLKLAQAKLSTLNRLIDQPRNTDLPICMEVRRVRKRLQTFVNKQILTKGDDK